jgi:hypothetical protein
MDTNTLQTGLASSPLPSRVVHRADVPATVGEDPDRIKAALRLND